MAAEAGPNPMSPEFGEWWEARKTKTGKMRRNRPNASEFKKIHTAMRKVRGSLTGEEYLLPEQDFNKLTTWYKKHESQLSPEYEGKKGYYRIKTPADLLDYALESSRQKKSNVEVAECPDETSHIRKVTYNSLYEVLRVEFRNGDICAFLDVDAKTAATLLIHAEHNNKGKGVDGTDRHMIGIEFWNLVRIRGTIHETRFPFQYTTEIEGESSPAPRGRRPGSGIHGEGNKYTYQEEMIEDKYGVPTGRTTIRRYPNNSKSDNVVANYRTGAIKSGRIEEEPTGLLSIPRTDAKRQLGKDALEDYFYGEDYENDLKKFTSMYGKASNKVIQLKQLEDMFGSLNPKKDDMNKAVQNIIDRMYDAGLDISINDWL